MKKDLSGKVHQFLTSEVGQVGIRAPLALGVASGTLLLLQMAHTPLFRTYTNLTNVLKCIRIYTNLTHVFDCCRNS